jgi:hypothetical protein
MLSPDSSKQRIRFGSTRCNSVRSESLGGNVGQLLGRSLRPTINSPARERTRHSAGSLRLPCRRELGHTPHRSLLSLFSFVGGCFRCLHARLFRFASGVFSLNGDFDARWLLVGGYRIVSFVKWVHRLPTSLVASPHGSSDPLQRQLHSNVHPSRVFRILEALAANPS